MSPIRVETSRTLAALAPRRAEIMLRRAETFEDLVALDGHRRPLRPRSLQLAVAEDAFTLTPEGH